MWVADKCSSNDSESMLRFDRNIKYKTEHERMQKQILQFYLAASF